MIDLPALAAVLILAASPPLETQGAVETSIIVPAPVAQVWAAFTTREGLESWMVGQARIDLRVGGELCTHYRKQGSLDDDEAIVHTILAVDPLHLLVLKPLRPPKAFPFPAAWLRTTNVLYFEALPGERTRVLDRMIGYDGSAEARRMRAFFEAGNRQTLDALASHFSKRRGAR